MFTTDGTWVCRKGDFWHISLEKVVGIPGALCDGRGGGWLSLKPDPTTPNRIEVLHMGPFGFNPAGCVNVQYTSGGNGFWQDT